MRLPNRIRLLQTDERNGRAEHDLGKEIRKRSLAVFCIEPNAHQDGQYVKKILAKQGKSMVVQRETAIIPLGLYVLCPQKKLQIERYM
jgi:hypothetical protein